ncbi:MAG: diaminopimelate decarboxylase [Azospirillaceae bacterium]
MSFRYRDGALSVEDVPLDRIAEAAGTPVYVYSSDAMTERYRAYERALAPLGVGICYALKANSNQAVIATFAGLGAGADVVSVGEMRRALAAGMPPGRIVFSGVGKTRTEMAAALDAGIHQINVESLGELRALEAVAAGMDRVATAAIRVNPDVDAQTHAKITTGRKENKFGIDIDRTPEIFAEAAAMPHVDLRGIAVHIGSQLIDLAPYRVAYAKLAEMVADLRAAGHVVDRLDLGGGVGIRYHESDRAPDLEAYAGIVAETVSGLDCALMVEPGRSLIGEAGVLLAEVVYVKRGASRQFLVLDAGMNDLLRPALYDAWHDLVPLKEPAAGGALTPYDVVGPICETGDTFARQRPLPALVPGDRVAFLSAGAYGAVMASTYNSRPLPAEVLVRGSDFAIVRNRPTLQEMIDADRLPPWLAGG